MADANSPSTKAPRRMGAALPEPPTAQASKPAAPAENARLYTAAQWAQGRPDPITRAFVSEHSQQRAVKRAASEWMTLYKAFLAQPRG